MLELRCRNGRLLGEVDLETLTLRMPCKTCRSVWGRPVYHRWPLGKLLEAMGKGQRDGVVYPEGELPADTDHH